MADHPDYRPTKRVEEQLRLLLRANVPVPKISDLLGSSETTLRRHYPLAFAEVLRRDGAKPHEPSDENRQKVRTLAAVGVAQENIAFVMGISAKTLTAYYRDELRQAEIEANSKVAAQLLAMALGPKDAKNTFLAAKWWSSARMGWSEKVRNEMTGADGGPIQTEQKVVVILPDNGRDSGMQIDADAQDVEVSEDRLLPAPESVEDE